MEEDPRKKLEWLEAENQSLRGAILLLHRIANLVRDAIEFEPTCYALLTGVTAGIGLGFNRAMLFLVDENNRSTLRGAAAVGPASSEEADRVWRSILADSPDLEALYEAGLRERANPGQLDRLVRDLKVDLRGGSPIALAMRTGNVIRGGPRDDGLGGLLHLPTAIASPLRGRHGIGGVLYADNIYTGREIAEVPTMVFSLLADQAGRAIEIAHQYEEVAQQARTDSLTGLAHHGALKDELERIVARSRDEQQPVGIVMIDLDDFKRINDTYGHLVGDALLAGVATRMRAVARSNESPYRYGGEEFTVVLRGADRKATAAVGERIRQSLAGRPFSVGTGELLRITCSVGVASLPEDGMDAKSIVSAADGALLKAKARGKNRVVAAGEE